MRETTEIAMREINAETKRLLANNKRRRHPLPSREVIRLITLSRVKVLLEAAIRETRQLHEMTRPEALVHLGKYPEDWGPARSWSRQAARLLGDEYS